MVTYLIDELIPNLILTIYSDVAQSQAQAQAQAPAVNNQQMGVQQMSSGRRKAPMKNQNNAMMEQFNS